MIIRRNTSENILATISESLVIIVVIIIVAVSLVKYSNNKEYKNYIVTNKYIRNSDIYVLELMNPFSKKTKEVYVRDYLYYNTYFVGDTIK